MIDDDNKMSLFEESGKKSTNRVWIFNRATLVNCVSIDCREHEHRPSRIDKRPLLYAFDLEEKVIRVGTMKRGTCTASAREELQR